jgi:hypothetical protein
MKFGCQGVWPVRPARGPLRVKEVNSEVLVRKEEKKGPWEQFRNIYFRCLESFMICYHFMHKQHMAWHGNSVD